MRGVMIGEKSRDDKLDPANFIRHLAVSPKERTQKRALHENYSVYPKIHAQLSGPTHNCEMNNVMTNLIV